MLTITIDYLPERMQEHFARLTLKEVPEYLKPYIPEETKQLCAEILDYAKRD